MAKRDRQVGAFSRDARWIEVSTSEFAHEREGLAYIKDRLPAAPPYRAWTNFDFMDGQGRWHEVDALVLGRGRLHLVELKAYKGTLAGNEVTWLRNGRRAEKSPLLLAHKKAQRLQSRLRDELVKLVRSHGESIDEAVDRLPYIQPSVFLHDPDLEVHLDRRAAANLFGFTGARNDLPDIMDRLLEPPEYDTVNDRDGQLLGGLLARLGIARQSRREAGSWLITGAPLDEGDGWQDWPAEHRLNADDEARIRVFLTPAGAPQSARAAVQRRVKREYQLLRTLKHDSIVTPSELLETEDGDPGLVYSVNKGFTPLDEVVDPRFTADQRMIILERTAEALAYAHRHRVAHRGLNPHSVQVSTPEGPAEHPEVRLADWSWAGRIHQDTASRSVLADPPEYAVDGSELYEAPEGRFSAVADRQPLDIFSLGALAFHLLTGSAPGADRTDVRDRLKAGNGLDLASAGIPYVDEQLRELVLDATRPRVSDRLSSAQDFADRLRTLRLGGEQQPEDEPDPLGIAPPGVIQGRFELLKILGEGSTARGLLVRDAEAEDETRVLKVATSAEAGERLRQEAQVLTSFGAAVPADVGVVRLLDDPLDLPHGRTALLLSSGGALTLGEFTRYIAIPLEQLESLGGQLLDVMIALDSAGVLHRDVKPANLGLTEQAGGRIRLTLFDFSLARGRVSALEAGTPPYLDPFLGGRERPSYDSAAEWYAAAVVLYEMATSGTPIYGDNRSDPAVLTEDVTVEPEFFTSAQARPAVADALTGFFRRALARDAKRRFGTIREMREAWSEVFRATAERPKRAAKPTPPAPLLPTVLDGQRALPVSVSTLQGLVTQLGRTAGSSGSAARRLVYLLVPTAPSEQDLDPLGTQGVYATALGVTQGRIPQLFERLHEKWSAHTDLGQALAILDDTVWRELVASGGVSTPNLLTTAVLAEHFPAEEANGGPAARRMVTGMVRLVLERSQRTERRLERRRYRSRIITIAATPLHLDVADAVATDAARQLQDAVSIGRQLLPGAVALPRLREVAADMVGDATVEGDSTPIPDRVLLRLATTRPDAVCLSGADELHAPDLPAEVAIQTVLHGLPAQQRVRPADIASRVAARFPALAAQLPNRPELDDLVLRARPDLKWRPDIESYADAEPPARGSTLTSGHGTLHGGPPRSPVGPLAIARLADGPVFRAFQVPDGRSDELACALAELLRGEWIDVTAELLSLLRERAEQAQVPWSTILAADAGPIQDRQGLAAFVEQALPELFDRISGGRDASGGVGDPGGSAGPAVLTDLSTLAAYGLLGRLKKWTDVTRPPTRTILALVPRGVHAGPVVDGTSLPLNSPDQFVSLSSRNVDSIIAEARQREIVAAGADTVLGGDRNDTVVVGEGNR